MARLLQHLANGPRFDDLSGVHHDNFVTDVGDHTDVVGHKEHGHAEAGLKIA
jgi:hypothetical protein